jgi:hypothetical protein
MIFSRLSRRRLISFSNSLRHELVPIPFDADDVCPMCRSWRHARFDKCSNCLEVEALLGAPCRRVVPITLYSKPSMLRDWLTLYKDEADGRHAEYRAYLATIVDRFLLDNLATLIDVIGTYDVVTFVSSSHRTGEHPLKGLINSCSRKFGQPVVSLLSRGKGEVGHRVMSDDAYLVTEDVSGRRILLVDDVYTTGSRAQSAASALQMAGATVVGILVIARRINPEFNSTANALWARQRDLSYDFRSALDWLIPPR